LFSVVCATLSKSGTGSGVGQSDRADRCILNFRSRLVSGL
jgi:hypothetical protein